jgi:hypothetical protein
MRYSGFDAREVREEVMIGEKTLAHDGLRIGDDTSSAVRGI